MQSLMTSGNQRDTAEVLLYIEESQLYQTQEIFLKSTMTCFDQCVKSFTAKDLDKTEQQCLKSCFKRVMEANSRVSQRYIEEDAKKRQEMMQ